MTNTSTLADLSDIRMPDAHRERETAQRNMLSAIAHDLKTPLASIIGSLEVHTLMEEKLSSEKKAQLIHVALQEAHRLDILITNVLDMARLESGIVKPKREKVDIASLLDHCIKRMDYQLPASAVALSEAPGTVPVMTDPLLLSRAVSLVLDNAFKYGGVPSAIRVEFGYAQSGYIRIYDNGGGIPPDQLEAVFIKYVRLESKSGKKSAGIGLGLTIAREIMRLLGGDAVMTNHNGGGALVTLSFSIL